MTELPNIDTSNPPPVKRKESIEDRFTKATGLNVDLSNLTLAGWALGLVAIAVAASALGLAFYVLGSALADDGIRVRRPGGGMLLIGIPVAILIAGVVFLLGKILLSSAGISISKTQEFTQPAAPGCKECGQQLRTAMAKQCFHCGASWH